MSASTFRWSGSIVVRRFHPPLSLPRHESATHSEGRSKVTTSLLSGEAVGPPFDTYESTSGQGVALMSMVEHPPPAASSQASGRGHLRCVGEDEPTLEPPGAHRYRTLPSGRTVTTARACAVPVARRCTHGKGYGWVHRFGTTQLRQSTPGRGDLGCGRPVGLSTGSYLGMPLLGLGTRHCPRCFDPLRGGTDGSTSYRQRAY